MVRIRPFYPPGCHGTSALPFEALISVNIVVPLLNSRARAPFETAGTWQPFAAEVAPGEPSQFGRRRPCACCQVCRAGAAACGAGGGGRAEIRVSGFARQAARPGEARGHTATMPR